MFESIRLSDLPSYAKLFVALFTALMLCVCFWAGWIYVVEKGGVDEAHLPAYMQKEPAKQSASTDVDTADVLAPIWDSEYKGEEMPIDSSAIANETQEHKEDGNDKRPSRFRHNIGLAHTHINGQTLLFFTIGLVFLFTSVQPQVKKAVFWIFGVAVLLHTIGLSGMGIASLYDDILAISGVVILLTIAYMALMIFADLVKNPRVQA